jgi:hypothetical protein
MGHPGQFLVDGTKNWAYFVSWRQFLVDEATTEHILSVCIFLDTIAQLSKVFDFIVGLSTF